jgi:hypothetical protein
VWIRRTELQGKIGGVESEASETFPISLVQKRDILQRLMELNIDAINSALYDPKNAGTLRDMLAFPEFKIPGEGQRMKQVLEIQELMKGEPVEGPMGLLPSIQVEPEVDDHVIHKEVLKEFLVDPVGLDLKQSNPAAYANCVAHLQLHDYFVQQELMRATMMAEPAPANKPGESENVRNGTRS